MKVFKMLAGFVDFDKLAEYVLNELKDSQKIREFLKKEKNRNTAKEIAFLINKALDEYN